MGAQMGTIVPSMSYHTFQQRSCPGKMGGMPVYGAHSNGPIQPSIMAVVTNGGGNRFSVENYLPSAAPPVPHPIRYTPGDLNHRLNSLHYATSEYDLTTRMNGLTERREGLRSAGLDVSRRPDRNPFNQALTSRHSTFSPYVAPAAYAVPYIHGAGWSQDVA